MLKTQSTPSNANITQQQRCTIRGDFGATYVCATGPLPLLVS
jgi:hypothetical protein